MSLSVAPSFWGAHAFCVRAMAFRHRELPLQYRNEELTSK
jgi:hypothetical protein